MSQSVEQRVCERILNLKDELVSILCELIAAPTPDPPGDNYDGFVRIPSGYMKALGAKVSIVQAPPELLPRDPATDKTLSRPNILAEIEGSKKTPILHLNGHYDVVPAVGNWTSDPYKPEVREGRIYGRGAHDMKSGIAAMMVAAKALRLENVNLKGTLSFSFVPDEEKDGEAGAKFLTEQKKIKADYCIVGESSGSKDFYNGHRGCLWLEITTYGKPSHGSQPWLGINAFDKMVSVIQEINTRIKPQLIQGEDTTIDRSTVSKIGSMTLGGKILTGDLPNIVPPQCIMTIDRRLAPGEEVQKVWNDFGKILDSVQDKDHKFVSDMKVLSEYEPCVTSLQSPLVEVLKESLKSVTGKVPEISVMMAGCDMRYFNRQGIPTVIYGPGDNFSSHQVDESVGIEALVRAAQAYALTAIRLMKGEGQ